MSITVKARLPKQRGAFDPTKVGFEWNNGKPYYLVASSKPQKYGPYRVSVTADLTEVIDCTCYNYMNERQLLPTKEEQRCKHMTGIQAILDQRKNHANI